MKVKLRIANNDRKLAGSLKPEVAYLVLAIETICSKPCYRIEISEDGTPRCFEVGDFDILVGDLPSSWIATHSSSGLGFCPEPWTRDGFWEAYFDFEPWAVDLYK